MARMTPIERLKIKRDALSRSRKRVSGVDRLIYLERAHEMKKDMAKALGPSNKEQDLFAGQNAC